MNRIILSKACHRAVIALLAVIACSVTTFSPQVFAAATTINVDFSGTVFWTPPPAPAGLYSSSAVAPDNGGTTWNSVSGDNGTSGPLVTSAGAATPVTVTLSGVNGSVDGTLFGNAAIAPALLNDYARVNSDGTVGSFSINGLVAGGSYDMYLYSQNQGGATSITIFDIGGSIRTATDSGNGNLPSFRLNQNYVLYEGLIASGAGNISGTFVTGRPGEDNGVFNGFQLVVPEPSTVALLMLGLLPLLRSRSR